MPGPAPSPFARRKNARPDWVRLPVEGFRGDVPEWPLPFEPALAVLDAWRELWRTPQAAMWAKEGHARMVARYALMLVDAESPDAKAALLAEVRQMEDRLGLSPMAMKRLQWEIGEGEASRSAASGGNANVRNIDDFRSL